MKLRKKIPLFLALVLGLGLVLPVFGGKPDLEATEGIRWVSYEKGLAQSQKQGKKIFLHFYSDWCAYCKKMADETFQNYQVVSYLNKNFIAIKSDSEKNQNLAMRYFVRGLPTTWFLTETGKKISFRPGYIPPEELLIFLKYIHGNAYDKMSLDDFKSSM